jgi:hypothetical protein
VIANLTTPSDRPLASTITVAVASPAYQSAEQPDREALAFGSANVPDWESWKTLVSVTAYHSFDGEVEASKRPPRYAASIPHAVTNFRG